VLTYNKKSVNKLQVYAAIVVGALSLGRGRCRKGTLSLTTTRNTFIIRGYPAIQTSHMQMHVVY
jgi:hypothetical protein